MKAQGFEKHRKDFKEAVEKAKPKAEQAGLFDKEIEQAWHYPEWSLLDDRRGELPDFPMVALPLSMHFWLLNAARGAGVTPAHVAVPLLGIVSSLIGTARRVRAARSWSEPLSLWMAVVGFSGTGKTPGLNVTRRVLSLLDRERKSKIADLQRAHETRAQQAKAANKKWESDVKDAVEAGQPTPPKPPEATELGPFVVPRPSISDATIERIAVLLEARPRGMAFIADELARLFQNMSRYSGGQDAAFWLEAWNGEHFVVERQGRPPVIVDHLILGVIGGFQPDKLASSFEGADDGMYARFMFGWPNEPDYQELANDVAEIEPEIQNALTRLIDMPAEEDGVFTPRYVEFAEDAAEAFKQFHRFHHAGKAALDGREREWWAKGCSHVLRLAGTLAYLDWAMTGGSEPQFIGGEYVNSAVQLWREYFWPHSRAALRQIGLSERHGNARRVLKWIRAHKKPEVSREDLRRDALQQQLDAEQTQKLIDGTLVPAGWLRDATKKRAGPGRQANRWEVNPKLFGDPPAAGIAGIAEIGVEPLIPAIPVNSRKWDGATATPAEIEGNCGNNGGSINSRNSRNSRNGVPNGHGPDLPEEDFIGPPGDTLNDFDIPGPFLIRRNGTALS